MYSPLKNILLTGGLTFSVIVGTLSVYALGTGTDIVALMDKILLDTSISTNGTVKNSDKIDGLHASDILNAAGGGNITFSTCSTTDKKQMFYECDPTLPACLTVGAYCGGGIVAGSAGGSLIVSAISDESNGTTWSYNNTSGIYNGAIATCSENKSFGFDNWKLPTNNELSLICTNRVIIGNFSEYINYWTSTESNASNAQYIYLAPGCSGGSGVKTDSYRVRCIRKY